MSEARPGTWFVCSNGVRVYPVTPEGWRAVWFFVAGVAWSGWRFIDTARKHTEYSVT